MCSFVWICIHFTLALHGSSIFNSESQWVRSTSVNGLRWSMSTWSRWPRKLTRKTPKQPLVTYFHLEISWKYLGIFSGHVVFCGSVINWFKFTVPGWQEQSQLYMAWTERLLGRVDGEGVDSAFFWCSNECLMLQLIHDETRYYVLCNTL